LNTSESFWVTLDTFVVTGRLGARSLRCSRPIPTA